MGYIVAFSTVCAGFIAAVQGRTWHSIAWFAVGSIWYVGGQLYSIHREVNGIAKFLTDDIPEENPERPDLKVVKDE